jgi:adenylosuccinate lyase
MASILLDEMLEQLTRVISDLQINTKRITENLEKTKGQIYAEFVLDALVKKGVPRFEAYRDIQKVAFAALESQQHFFDAVTSEPKISKHLSRKELEAVFDAKNHLGASAKIINSVASAVRNAPAKKKK